LIHKHHPELIDFDKLRKDKPLENLNYAFDVADKHLDIPKMLDAQGAVVPSDFFLPSDIVDAVKPDERSIMTYVVAFYKKFATANKVSRCRLHCSPQAETASKKIATVLETNRAHEQLIRQYEEMVSNLLEWIRTVLARLNERPPLETVVACQVPPPP
jgi:hypothetical protein